MTPDFTEQKLILLQKVLNEKLLDACQEGDYHKAREALEQGADVNCQDADEYTPLHHAAVNCYYDIAN